MDALKEWKLVLSIIDPMIKNYNNTFSKIVKKNLKKFSKAIRHNYVYFTTGKWERFQGMINAEANQIKAHAETKKANAHNSMANTARGYTLVKILRWLISETSGQATLAMVLGAIGLKKVSDSFNVWSSGITSSS